MISNVDAIFSPYWFTHETIDVTSKERVARLLTESQSHFNASKILIGATHRVRKMDALY